jgi:hypothetical protein
MHYPSIVHSGSGNSNNKCYAMHRLGTMWKGRVMKYRKKLQDAQH